ncbi:hypothetical protein [Caviibacter abscessus]|uniref:hypothetical protein n=1 Tax=Caviibacter abscessus TaxID=1766719 RepID=UPI000834828E|nr:hypothetical protein [Caviibacter abscessus]
MKKIIFLIFVSTLNVWANQKFEFYNIDNSSKFGVGTNYNRLSLEAIYERKLDSSQLEEKKLKEYFKNGNSIGFNVNYNLGAKSKKPTIQLLREGKQTKVDLFETDKKTEYKLFEGKDASIYSYNANKIINSGRITLKGNFKSENELMKKQMIKVASILKKNSRKLLNTYGEIKGINVEMNTNNSARYLNSNKVVLYFNKEN